MAGLYVIADDDPRWRHPLLSQVAAALEGGARVLQLRMKHTRDGDALVLLRRALELARPAGALVIVNDRFDLALCAGANGVHLGQEDLAPARIPTELLKKLVVGRSTHTREQVVSSRDEPVDYVAFGPVFASDSKPASFSARGLAALREAAELAAHPVVAIGGITLERISSVAAQGAAAAAVISAVADAPEPTAAVRELARGFARGVRA